MRIRTGKVAPAHRWVCFNAQVELITPQSFPKPYSTFLRLAHPYIDQDNELTKELTLNSQIWMSHADTISELPEDFEIIAELLMIKKHLEKFLKQGIIAEEKAGFVLN